MENERLQNSNFPANRKKFNRKLLLTVVGVLAYKASKVRKTVSKRRWWAKRNSQLINELAFYETTFQNIKNVNSETFAKAVRMSPQTFDKLLDLIRFRLEKTSIRGPISLECRLFMTLMYLAHGGSRRVYASSFKVTVTTLGNIIHETCKTLWDELNEIYLSPPNSKEWTDIAKEFEDHWRLPNCIGAIDGKYINVVCPPQDGSLADSHKGTQRVLLLAACDAQYSFKIVDTGTYASQCSGGVLPESSLGRLLADDKLNIPESSILPLSDDTFPYFFVGNKAFALRRNLMRNFPGKCKPDEENFNQRISLARVTIENAFGILFSRWKILKNEIHALPSNADAIVKTTVLLHNILMFMKCPTYCPFNYADRFVHDEVVPGEWRKETLLENLTPSRSHNPTQEAWQLRKKLCQYLVNFK